jgi:hypothetical protein
LRIHSLSELKATADTMGRGCHDTSTGMRIAWSKARRPGPTAQNRQAIKVNDRFLLRRGRFLQFAAAYRSRNRRVAQP